jgi:hypothetical protein
MGKASGSDRFDVAPTSANSQNRRLNKPRKCLFAKREFGTASVQTKLYRDDGRAISAGSPQPKWQPPFQFP